MRSGGGGRNFFDPFGGGSKVKKIKKEMVNVRFK